MRINQEEQLGSKRDPQSRAPVQGNEASKPPTTPVGVAVAGDTARLTGEFIGEIHGVLEVHKPTHLGISIRMGQFDCG